MTVAALEPLSFRLGRVGKLGIDVEFERELYGLLREILHEEPVI